MDWYNNLIEYNINSYIKLANLFLDHFRINIKDKIYITNITKQQKFLDESVTNFISRWRVILTSMPYTLPQEEFVNMFSQSCLWPIASTLLIQQHNTFKEAISQSIIIKKVKIEDGEIKTN